MPESIALTTPDQVKAGTPEYRIAALIISPEGQFIEVHLRGVNGELRVERYDSAGDLIRALNTANLTTKSLQRRIMEKLIADGRLAGTVAGTPD